MDAARAARLAYDRAVTSDGVSVAAWWAIASDLHFAAADLIRAGATRGQADELTGHARDAEHRAVSTERRTALAVHSRRQVIPVMRVIEAVT
jgi:hypothetical protein